MRSSNKCSTSPATAPATAPAGFAFSHVTISPLLAPATSASLGLPPVPLLRKTQSIIHALRAMRPDPPGPAFAESLFGGQGLPVVECNCCAAVANAARHDEALDRLGRSEELLEAVVALLRSDCRRAAGHAARALGNLAYLPANCDLIHARSARDVVQGVLALAAGDAAPEDRAAARALFAVGNLSGNARFCAAFGASEPLARRLRALQAAGDPARREAANRAVAVLANSQFGTRTWRHLERL